MSQIVTNFPNTMWISVISATMSFTYSTIGLGLGFAKLLDNGVIFYKASIMAVCTTTFFYLSCGVFGYAAFGNSTPGNLMTGFGFYEPYWLIDFANACIVINLVGGYQVSSQALFGNTERWIVNKFPNCKILQEDFCPLPCLRVNILRLCFRICYVPVTTCIATLVPYFHEVVGVAGAVNFWPIVVYFLVEMYLVQKKIGSWTKKSIILRIYSFVTFVVMLYDFIGSVKGLVTKFN